MGEVKYSYSNLLSFDSVVDMELGMINFMMAKYHKSFYFNQNVVNASSENVKKNMLLARTNKNPLTVLLNGKAISSADSMLKEIKEKYMKEVIAFSKPNDILRFVKTLQQTDGVIKCTINCKNELEKQYINKLDDSLAVVMNEIDMTCYDALFLKYIDDIVNYRNMGGKYIYVSNYQHNIDQETGEPKKIILVASGYNKIRMIDPYIGLTISKVGGNING
jgi:hypothetical protein